MRVFNTQRNKGFTIPELLVAFAVISILASVGYVSLDGGRQKARDAERMAVVEQMRLAFRLWKEDTGAYPAHNGGVVLGEGNSIDAALQVYFSAISPDPLGPSGTTYEYVYDSQFNCSGTNRIVLYAKTMERTGAGNWGTVCGSTSGGTSAQTYGVILF